MSPARRRRDGGEGSVYKRADGMWIGSYETGWVGGVRKRGTVSSKDKATAIRKLAEKRAQYAQTGVVADQQITVAAWLTRWLEDIARLRNKPRTVQGYRTEVTQHLIPHIGRRRLDQLQPQHVRDLHAALRKAGLQPATVLKAHSVLRKALGDAMREGLIVRNVASSDYMDAPRRDNKQVVALDSGQAEALLRFVAEDPIGSRWAAALLLGARQGELLGLTWDRVNLQEGTVDLAWQLQRLGYRHGCQPPCGRKFAGNCPDKILDVPPGFEYQQVAGALCLTRPKSRAGRRVVPLPDVLRAFLVLHGRLHGMDGFVWSRDDGRPFEPRQDYDAWQAALKAAGLPKMKLHSARHSAATFMLEAGTDVKVIGEILGQSTVVSTRGYQQVSRQLARAALEQVAATVTTRSDPVEKDREVGN